jgi:hypothetical protein
MTTVNLSIYGGVGWQFFDNNGNPLVGGLLYTYEAGTTTPLATYTSSSGATAHTNPIVLDSAAKVPGGEIWLDYSKKYKFVVKTSTGVLLNTYDNIGGSFNLSDIVEQFEGDGVETEFILTSTTPTTAANIYINGVYQNKDTYVLAVDTITFSEAPPLNSTIEVVYS